MSPRLPPLICRPSSRAVSTSWLGSRASPLTSGMTFGACQGPLSRTGTSRPATSRWPPCPASDETSFGFKARSRSRLPMPTRPFPATRRSGESMRRSSVTALPPSILNAAASSEKSVVSVSTASSPVSWPWDRPRRILARFQPTIAPLLNVRSAEPFRLCAIARWLAPAPRTASLIRPCPESISKSAASFSNGCMATLSISRSVPTVRPLDAAPAVMTPLPAPP